jgi:hypothetical protein
MVPVNVAASALYFTRHTGQLEAYGQDTRQALLFDQGASAPTTAETDKKVITLKS